LIDEDFVVPYFALAASVFALMDMKRSRCFKLFATSLALWKMN